MKPPVLSVVIPTRDRREILVKTLRALNRQREVDGRFEVIIIDDGSDDGTVDLIRGSVFETYEHRVLTVSSGGPARARNFGVADARADRILLLGDDTVPTPLALAAHLKGAAQREVAVQGRIDWASDEPVTDVMRFLAPEGPQFWFRGLSDGVPVRWSQVLGSNLSAPTAWLREEPFDEQFTDACMEDTELAWRWRRQGWPTLWSEHALCHHHHRYETIEPFVERQRRTGRWSRVAVAKHRVLAGKLILEPLAVHLWKALNAWRWRFAGKPRERDEWGSRCRRAYLRGLADGPPGDR